MGGRLLLLACGMGILAYTFHRGGLNAAASAASIIGVIPFFASVIIWARNRTRPAPSPGAAHLRDALEDIAGDEKEQWLRELGARQLYDPEPVAVCWQLSDSSIGSLQGVGTVTGTDLGFAGAHDPAELAAWFWRLERRRLVIVAEAGMGKTTLAITLLLELLKLVEASAGQPPVPVLFSISAFNPFTEDFDLWLARRLGEDLSVLPDIVRREDRDDEPLRIVQRRHVIPILDGLDELSPDARGAAFTKLNAALADGELGFILTCRSDEWEATVAERGMLRSTHVIEALPLAREDVRAYLETHIPNRMQDAWQPVLTSISDKGSIPGNALNTPLMLWLVYQVYVRTGRDPRELTDGTRFPQASSVQSHLFRNLIPALIDSYPPDSRLPGRPRRKWDAPKAEGWLKYLAWHLRDRGSYDLAWWQLPAAMLRKRT